MDRTVSPLANFPTSGSSTVQNPMQRSVGLQRGVLSGQFYPNKLDIGIHLRNACGLPDALAFLPVSSSLFLVPLVLPSSPSRCHSPNARSFSSTELLWFLRKRPSRHLPACAAPPASLLTVQPCCLSAPPWESPFKEALLLPSP